VARGRFIGREVSTSPKLAQLETDRARLLWTWMVPHADRDGRIGGDPIKVRGLVVPNLGWTLEEIAECLEELERARVIRAYVDANGRRVVEICAFHEHQAGMRYDREAPSKFTPEESGLGPELSGLGPELSGLGPELSGVTEPKLLKSGRSGVVRTRSGGVRLKLKEVKLSEGDVDARAREASPAQREIDPRAERLAAELCKYRQLSPIGDNEDRISFSEALLGVIDAAGVKVEEALGAIAQAAAEVDGSMAPGAIRRKVQIFCRNARPIAEIEHAGRKLAERGEHRTGYDRKREAQFAERYENSRKESASMDQAGAAAASILGDLRGGR
jgi:hypothetical protein